MKRKFHFFYLFAFVIAVLFVSCTPNDSEDQVDSTQMIQDENGDSGDVSQEGTEGDNTDQTTQENNGNSDNTSQEGTEGGNTDQTTQDNNGNSDNTSQEGTEGGNTDETTQDNNGNTDGVNQGETEVVNTDIAPDFTLTELDGKQIKFSDYEGKVLVMFFFGNSCPSCKTVATQIQSKLANKFESNEAFAIVGLDQWNGNASSVRNFKSVTGVQFPLLLGASSTASAYKTTYDRLLVVDKKGAIQFRGKRNATNDLDDVVTITATYLEKQ